MRAPARTASAAAPVPASPSVPGGQQLAQLVRPERDVAALAERLLVGVWVVESLGALPETFRGVAVTRAGRLFDARTGELSQAPAGGAERLLEELARRDELVAASEQAVRDEAEARAALERLAAAVAEADAAREAAESDAAHGAARGGRRRGGREPLRVADRPAPRGARRRARGGAARRAARRPARRARLAERIEREREERARALAALRTGAERDLALAADADRAAEALESARERRRGAPRRARSWSSTPAPRPARRPPPR